MKVKEMDSQNKKKQIAVVGTGYLAATVDAESGIRLLIISSLQFRRIMIRVGTTLIRVR